LDTPVKECKGSPVRRGAIFRMKMIQGYAYVCGGNRSAGKRLDKGEWFSHSEAIPKLADSSDAGFEDIAGFSENDLYAVGGKGDVWHYNGKTWQQVSFPTNIWTTTVCCGGDGNVYISCYEGLTFMGRDNRWKKIYDGGISLGFKDMVWHEGKVWCTNDNGVWTIENGKLARASGLPSEIYVCSGSLSVNDGVMLMAGLGGAAFMEQGQWHNLFLRGEMEMAVRKSSAP
ncbi:WD40/YVTN/BNR-like repeat-containing protein, partial [Massilia scottii]|uniref:WD40/YVTN/BNR-like repeat-containing protein n=1 Tax=Massilia scottii TaxID=3057166 RepID=UPI0027969B36